MKPSHAFASFCFSATLLLGSAGFAFAQGGGGVTGKISEGLGKAAAESGYVTAGTTTDLPTIVGRIIGVALTLLGVLLLAYILYGGFLWMTAQGEPKSVEKAKDVIKNAVIGLVIIVSAYAIATFVLEQLGGVLSGNKGK